jgi:heat shock protein HspQ
MEKALAANKAGDDEATKTHQRKMQMIQGKMQKLKQNEEVQLGEECEILFESHFKLGDTVKCKASGMTGKVIKLDKEHGSEDEKYYTVKRSDGKQMKYAPNELTLKEEVEELDELDKKTLGSYVSKSHDQLMKHTGTVNMKYGRGDKDATAYALDKDALRKTANRTQGMKTALNKLTKEEVEEYMQTEAYEQLDELSKDTLASYVKKSAADATGNAGYIGAMRNSGSNTVNKAYDKLKKRHSGIDKATNKLAKEDTMLTYSEFMAQLAEGRADDLKDKLAADREARLNKYDYSKEKDTKKSPVQKVKGHSYGAGEEEGEDDEGTTKTVKPAAEKRGRGRPAGSKSGARV